MYYCYLNCADCIIYIYDITLYDPTPVFFYIIYYIILYYIILYYIIQYYIILNLKYFFSDNVMPVMDGPTACEKIRVSTKNKDSNKNN